MSPWQRVKNDHMLGFGKGIHSAVPLREKGQRRKGSFRELGCLVPLNVQESRGHTVDAGGHHSECTAAEELCSQRPKGRGLTSRLGEKGSENARSGETRGKQHAGNVSGPRRKPGSTDLRPSRSGARLSGQHVPTRARFWPCAHRQQGGRPRAPALAVRWPCRGSPPM